MVRPAALTLHRSPLTLLLGERARIVRFAMTGGIAALMQLLLLEVLSERGLPALAANGLAFLLAAQGNFWLSQLFTWRDRADDLAAGSVAARLVRFHGAIVGTALLNMAVFAFSATVLPELVAAVLGIGAAAAVNFVSGDRFVFRAPRAQAVGQLVSRAVIVPSAPDAPETAGHQTEATTPSQAAEEDTDRIDGPRLPARPGQDRGRLWARLGMVGVVLLAAVLYGWGLARNGMGNEYYSAAAISGAVSWKAFFFGSLDPGSFITVDKPPVAIWVQALSVRLFGLSSWSVLLPQALLALSVLLAVLTMTRRQFGPPAAILAGLVLVVTPVTVAVARVNLPDTMLIVLMVGGAWGTFEAIRRGQLRWLLLGMALVGVGFNTKMLQAFVVAPALFGTYLLTAPGGIFRRMAHVTLAGLVLLAVSASWMLVVDAIPEASRPYIGGSSDNSVLNLTLGYNGLGRVFGQGLARGASPAEIVTRVLERFPPAATDAGAGQSGAQPAAGGAGGGPQSGGPGGGGPGFGGQPGTLRLFNQQIGGQIGWLLPLAAMSLLAGLVVTTRGPRTDLTRAWYLLWGGWLVTHVVVFSFASGILHPYYTAALGPSIAALCGPGVAALWQGYRRSWWLVLALPASLAGTAAVSVRLVMRSSWGTWLAPAIIGAVGVGVAGLLIARLIRRPIGRQLALGSLMFGLVGVLVGPTAWAVTPLGGSGMAGNPLAGPQDSVGFGRGGPGGPGGPSGSQGGPPMVFQPPAGFVPPAGMHMPPGFRPPDGAVGQDGAIDQDEPAGQEPAGQGSARPGLRQSGNGPAAASDGAQGGTVQVSGPPAGGPGGPGGRVSQELLAYLVANRGSAEYLVAVNSSMAAAPIILETRLPVVAMGGFSGGDPAPTAEGLAELVASGRLRFVMAGGRGGPGAPGGGGVSSERSAWVQANCALVDPAAYGAAGASSQLYDCAPSSGVAPASAVGGG